MRARMTEKQAHAKFMLRTGNIFRHQRERAESKGAVLDYDLADVRLAVELKLNQPCRYCCKKITVNTFSLDHFIPIERGGEFTKGNTSIICQPCNSAKGKLTHEEFTALLRTMSTWDESAMRDTLGRLKAGNVRFGIYKFRR